jgi:serine/threonine protein kinase
MGEVYLCKDTHLKRKVSLKFLPVEFPDDTKSVEQIGQDAKAVSALRHPNICTVQEIRKHNAQHFVVMEPLEGQTLRDYILSGKHLETAKVIDLASQITDALDIAHQNGIIHRAIKAENIFITKEGQAKILNFALTCLSAQRKPVWDSKGGSSQPAIADGQLIRPGLTVEAIVYMSPEELLGGELDSRADLYSFGVVLYEMTTGALPFKGTTVEEVVDAILHKLPISPLELNRELPQELVRIILTAMAKYRELGFRSARELRSDLEALKESYPLTTATVTGRQPVPTISRALHQVREAPNALWRIGKGCLKWYERQRNGSMEPLLDTHRRGRASMDSDSLIHSLESPASQRGGECSPSGEPRPKLTTGDSLE